jgi:hypothetical protein
MNIRIASPRALMDVARSRMDERASALQPPDDAARQRGR